MEPNLEKLKGILNKSQAIMNEVNTGKYDKNRKNNPAPRPAPAPRRQPQMNENFNTNTQMDSSYAARVNGSGFSEDVKKAMINNPIPTDMSTGWNASDILGESYGTGTQQTYPHGGAGGYVQPSVSHPPQNQYYPPQNQHYPSHPPQASLTTEDVKNIVKEVLSEMMMSSITENAVKSTLKTMISEGKLKTKKRT
jgi:hypothetical protein